MSNSKGWFNLEAAGGAIPDTQFFEGDSAFKFLGLTRMQRIYGFIGWYVSHCFPLTYPPMDATCLHRLSVYSLGIGFVLSLLGSIFLFLGSLTSFACMCSIISCLPGLMLTFVQSCTVSVPLFLWLGQAS